MSIRPEGGAGEIAMTSTFAVVGIHRQSDGGLPDAMIRLAYRASRRARIALLLDGVSPAEIDRLLDPLVAQCRRDIPGLIYIQRRNPPCEATHALDVQFDLASPGTDSGVVIRCRAAPGPGSARAILDRLARPTRLEETAAS
jgi:hypothetical protein